jgi:hypothetical protein
MVFTFLRRHFHHSQRVTGGAKHSGSAERADGVEPRKGTHAAGGGGERAALGDRVEGAPEANERAKGKGEHHAVAGRDLSGVEHELPAVEPPLPVVVRVEYDERTATGARGAVVADVAFERVGEIIGEAGVGGV